MFKAKRNSETRKSNFLSGRGMFSSRQTRRKSAVKLGRSRRNLQLEGLQKREMFSVSSLWFSGNTLVVQTDNAATSMAVSLGRLQHPHQRSWHQSHVGLSSGALIGINHKTADGFLRSRRINNESATCCLP